MSAGVEIAKEPARGPACPLCASASRSVGSKVGGWRARRYGLSKCTSCGLAFVDEPDVDYAEIYCQQYYEGRGADPLVDYHFELHEPQHSIRRLEWRGIHGVVQDVRPLAADARWLDYGCGSGGLVRYLRERGVAAEGFDEGGIVEESRSRGVPILTREQLEARAGTYDVVTAIEVVEHFVSPSDVFDAVATSLRPGGIFFFTTGNAERFAKSLLSWGYFRPEIHVSLYEPRTAARALEASGLTPRYVGWSRHLGDIVAFKILKNLRFRRSSPLDELLARSPFPRIADLRYGVSAFPIGVKPLA